MIVPIVGLGVLLALALMFIPHQQPAFVGGSLSFHQAVDAGPLPDLSGERDIVRRKTRFFEYLLPLVQAENHRLADIRQRLLYIQERIRFGCELDSDDQVWLGEVLVEFRMMDRQMTDEPFWPEILKRADQLPENLVLVQAANESAWGTSRFASEGNNLFGQWCFSPGCGMVPEGRPQGETYEVARFKSVPHAIAAYMRNLNSGHAYDKLREIRAQLRLEGHPVTAVDLVDGLTRYSERGEDYISELLAMLRVNAPLIDEIRSAGPGKPEA